MTNIQNIFYHNVVSGLVNFEKFLLKALIVIPQKAKDFAETVSKLIGLDIVIDDQVAQL